MREGMRRCMEQDELDSDQNEFQKGNYIAEFHWVRYVKRRRIRQSESESERGIDVLLGCLKIMFCSEMN